MNHQLLFKAICVVFALIAFSSCRQNNEDTEAVIARVGERKLLLSDLDFLFTEKKNPEDSADIARNYVEGWKRKQIFLQAAEEKFKGSDEEINRKIEDYRAQLLIHALQKQYIEENIDTVITDAQIDEYYEQNKELFRLNYDLVEVFWAKVSLKEDIATEELQALLSKPSDENLKKAYDFCTKYCVGFGLNRGNWLPFSELSSMEAFGFKKSENLPLNRIIEGKDDSYLYFWRINSIMREGQYAPKVFLRGQIVESIINKRKTDLYHKLEDELFTKAKEQGKL